MKPVRLLLLLCISTLIISSITLVVLRAEQYHSSNWHEKYCFFCKASCSSWKFGCGLICCSFNINDAKSVHLTVINFQNSPSYTASSNTDPPGTEKTTMNIVTGGIDTENMSSYSTDEITVYHISASSSSDSTPREITKSTLSIPAGNTVISLSIEIIIGSCFFISIIVVLSIIVCFLFRQNRQVTQSLQREVRTFLQRVPSTYNRAKGRRRRRQMEIYNDNRNSLTVMDDTEITDSNVKIGTMYKTERVHSSPQLLNQYSYNLEKAELDYRSSSGGEYRRPPISATFKPTIATDGYRDGPYLNVGSETSGISMKVDEEIDIEEQDYDEVV